MQNDIRNQYNYPHRKPFEENIHQCQSTDATKSPENSEYFCKSPLNPPENLRGRSDSKTTIFNEIKQKHITKIILRKLFGRKGRRGVGSH